MILALDLGRRLYRPRIRRIVPGYLVFYAGPIIVTLYLRRAR